MVIPSHTVLCICSHHPYVSRILISLHHPVADAAANIDFSKARPTPVLIDGYRLTYTPIPDRTTAFFLPVYHIYGQFQKGLDGSTDLKTDNTEGNIKSFGLYLTRLPGSPSNFRFSGPQL